MAKAEFHKLPAQDWDQVLRGFSDATIYQTHAYGSERWGSRKLEHVLLKDAGQVVAAAQVTVARFPLTGAGVAYLPWGPLWRPRHKEPDPAHFGEIAAALLSEFSERRRMLVRMAPAEFAEEGWSGEAGVLNAGWKRSNWKPPHRTMVVDLRRPLEVIRKEMSSKWRENLRRGERGLFSLVEGTEQALLGRFRSLFQRMWEMKQFVQHVDYEEFVRVNACLPEDLKLATTLCTYEGRDVAGVVWTAIGRIGIPLFSASVDEGRKLRAAYLMRWKALERMREKGCEFLDQGGISEAANPGSYAFKEGMGGKIVNYAGYFETCQSAWCEGVVGAAQWMRATLARWRHSRRKPAGGEKEATSNE
jgi:hypothetical protein